MLTEEQQHARLTGIGGSDVAKLWGLLPKAQAIDLFYEKRPDLIAPHGYAPQEWGDDFALDRGSIFEAPIAELYTKRTGNKLRQSHVMHRHPKYDWLIANIDRKREGAKIVSEIKSVSHWLANRWGPDGTDEVAEYYLPQPHHYMLVLDYPKAEVIAMIGMDDMRIYPMARDKEMDQLIIETTHDFWHNNVLKGEPPELDANLPSIKDALTRVYRLVSDEEITLPAEAEHWHQVRLEALERVKGYQAVADSAEHHIQTLMGLAGKARIPGVKGAYVREHKHRDSYTVAETDYIQTRYSARMK